MMDTLILLWQLLKPWLCFVVFIYLCIKMTGWAKNRKAGAIAFGLFFQMILPDPSAESTIEAVAERKQEVKKQQDGDKEPKDEDETLKLP
ncbi:hypothetical protein [Paraglaciecola arctica]|nr:hypothetical protein [Paraglaciecola arctica]